MKPAIISILVAIIIYKTGELVSRPKFKVGDCVIHTVKANEFEPARTVGGQVKILEVGKDLYKTTNAYPYLYPEKEFDVELILDIDSFYSKVECK